MGMKTWLIAGMMYLLARNVGAQSIEAMASRNYTTLDLKLGGNAGKIELFDRTRITAKNEHEVGYFSLLDITYPLGKGFGLMEETQFSGMVDPRLGASYDTKIGPASVFGQVTRSMDRNDYEFVGKASLADAGYRMTAETTQNFGKRLNFQVYRMRLEKDLAGFWIGPALDIYKDQAAGTVTVGLALEKRF